MKSIKKLKVIKIICILGLFFQTLLVDSLNQYYVNILILILIINNGVRWNYLKNERVKKGSFIIDLVVILLLSVKGRVQCTLGAVLIIIDGFYFLKESSRTYLNYICILINAILILNNINTITLYSIIFIIIIIMLIDIMRFEELGKRKAQRLYDKLRISEEELREANKKLKNYSSTIEELTLLKERNRISRDIHDSVGHSLSTTMIQLNAIEQVAKIDSLKASELAKGLREFVKESLDDVRSAMKNLKPENYASYEWIIRIEEYIKECNKLTNTEIKIILKGKIWGMKYEDSNSIFRIIQESITNSIKHGNAKEVDVILKFESDNLVITIRDDGRGTDKIENLGVGLRGIKERVQILNGSVNFVSKKNEGFKTIVNIWRKDIDDKLSNSR